MIVNDCQVLSLEAFIPSTKPDLALHWDVNGIVTVKDSALWLRHKETCLHLLKKRGMIPQEILGSHSTSTPELSNGYWRPTGYSDLG